MAQIVTITNPLTGQPAQVDQLEHTAQEIDDAIARAIPGGAIDIALQKKADLFKTLRLDGADKEVTIPNTAGWYRLIEFGNSMQSAILHIKHQYYSSGPCDMLVYVSCYNNYAVHILSATSYLNNVITIDDLRLVSNSTTRKYYLDIHYKFNSINGIGVDIIGTTAQVDWLVDSTRMNLEPVDTLPDGETVVKTAEWENPPMELGVEYRTTERYQGKPVYTKLLSGVMLGQDKRLDIPHGISNLQCIFDARGNLGNAIIPYYAPNNQFSSTAYGMHVWTGTELVFVESTGYSYAGSTVYVQIKYIKTKN